MLRSFELNTIQCYATITIDDNFIHNPIISTFRDYLATSQSSLKITPRMTMNTIPNHDPINSTIVQRSLVNASRHPHVPFELKF